MITLIVLFVVGLLLYAVVRFNRKANPTPANFTHNTKLEVAWTVVPVFILLGIAVFSLPELFRQQEIPEGDVNIKVTDISGIGGMSTPTTVLVLTATYLVDQRQ